MLKFIVAVIAAVGLCCVAYHFYPAVSHVAFHVPQAFDGAKIPGVGGVAITWMMLLGSCLVIGVWRVVKGK